MYNVVLKIKREKSAKTIRKPQSSDQMQALIVSPKSVESDLGLFRVEWCIQEGFVAWIASPPKFMSTWNLRTYGTLETCSFCRYIC